MEVSSLLFDLELQLDLRDASGIPLLLKSGQRHLALLQMQFDLANSHSDLFDWELRQCSALARLLLSQLDLLHVELQKSLLLLHASELKP